MEQRNIGNSSLKVSLLGLGGNNFGHRLDLHGTASVVHKALDLGITFFDTADVYGGAERYGDGGRSEEFLGKALGRKRNDVVLATKFGLPMREQARPVDASREYIFRAVEDSLRRLNTEWIDLYMLHKPDPETPITETLEALARLAEQGKIRHIGCSNLSAAQLKKAHEAAEAGSVPGFISCQEEYSLLARKIETELLPEIEAEGVGLIPYFPLASGLLTGKYATQGATGRLTKSAHHAERFLNDKSIQRANNLEAIAKAHGHSLLQLAFGWLAARPAVCTIIAGASSPAQLEDNAKAFSCAVTAQEIHEIDLLQAA